MASICPALFRVVLIFSIAFSAVKGAVTPTGSVTVDPTPTFDFSVYPECNVTTKIPQIDVPKLAKEFSLKVEGKSQTDGKFDFFDSEGYYEEDGQRGATVVYHGGNKSTYLYDFITERSYDIEGDKTCTKTSLFDTGCSAYAVFIAELAGHSNVTARCNFTNNTVTYLGEQGDNATVRAIPVRKWTQCVYDSRTKTLFASNYFYNKKGLGSPSGTDDVPIRFESRVLNGSAGHPINATSTYDFTYYVPNVVDKSVFMPATGVFCPDWTRENKTMPTLPSLFSLSMLTVAKIAGEVHSLRMSFDYTNLMASFIADSVNGTHFPPVIGKGKALYRTVHDYKSGLAFVMPVEMWSFGAKTCNVSAIDNSSIDSVKTSNTSSAHLRQSNELFGMGRRGNWTYIGQRNFSAVPCYVWATQRQNAKQIVLTESYWMHENWTTTGEPAFAGMMLYRKNPDGSAIETYQTIVGDFSTYPIRWQTFDVDTCLRTGHPILLTFTVKVANYSDVVSRVSTFETGIRSALSTLLKMSPLRYTDISITKGRELNQPQVWLTLMEWVNTTSGMINATAEKPSPAVLNDLKGRMAGDVDVIIFYGGKNQTVTLLKNSLQSGSDLVKPTTPASATTPAPPAPPAQIIQDGYTGGAMAGLAFAMIIIGSVAGLVAGFLLWKRNTGIAYQVYD